MINAIHYKITVSFRAFPFRWASEYQTSFTINSKEKMDKPRLTEIAKDSLDIMRYRGYIVKIPKDTITVDKVKQERSYS